MLGDIFGHLSSVVHTAAALFVLALIAELPVRGNGSPLMPAEHKYEEYYIEHEISTTQAKNSVLHFNVNSLTPHHHGCQQCTKAEIHYCEGASLMNDHCCCDKRYREELPFIPHTCYLGAQICKTIVEDCLEYTRLRICCCDHILRLKWKEKSSASINTTTKLPLCVIISLLFLKIVLY